MSNSTTEALRRGERTRSEHREIARDRVSGGIASNFNGLAIDHTAGTCHPERPRVEQRETRGSRRIPAMLVPVNTASGSSHHALGNLRQFFQNALQTFRAALREIFDESAYDRFLLRTHESRSVDSYRAFTRERDAAMLKKPRCC
ncbi:MAG TPA: hypothetical protein VH724_16535 [Candidatus Angelobacter sp.]|nr:hypothetical protein [Candidatus Angelobacter sp.]